MRIDAQSWPKMPVTETSAAPIRSASRIASTTYAAPKSPPNQTQDGAPPTAGSGSDGGKNTETSTTGMGPAAFEIENTLLAPQNARPAPPRGGALPAIGRARPAPAMIINRT